MHSVNWEEILKETAEDGKALSHYLTIDLDDPKKNYKNPCIHCKRFSKSKKKYKTLNIPMGKCSIIMTYARCKVSTPSVSPNRQEKSLVFHLSNKCYFSGVYTCSLTDFILFYRSWECIQIIASVQALPLLPQEPVRRLNKLTYFVPIISTRAI